MPTKQNASTTNDLTILYKMCLQLIMRQQKFTRDKQIQPNPYIHHIYKELIKTIDTETLHSKMKNNNLDMSFDDNLLVRAHRALPKMDSIKEIEKESKQIKGHNIYYDKLMMYEKKVLKSMSNKNSQRTRNHRISNKFVIALSTLEKQKYQKSLNLRDKIEANTKSLKEKSLEFFRDSKTRQEQSSREMSRNSNRYFSIEYQNIDSSEKKKREIMKNSNELKIQEKQMSLRMKINSPAQSNRDFISGEKSEKMPKLNPLPISDGGSNLLTLQEDQMGEILEKVNLKKHFDEHNFIFKEKSKEKEPEADKINKSRKYLKEKDHSKSNNHSSLLPLNSPPRKPRKQFIKKYNWKIEPFPISLQNISKDEFQCLIKGYLNLGCINEIPYGFFKAYIGPGNNNSVIKKALKDRGYWIFVNSLQENPNFVWTQLHYEQFTKTRKFEQFEQQDEKKSRIEDKFIHEINKKQVEVMSMSPDLKQFIDVKKNDFILGCRKILPEQTYIKYMNLLKEKFKLKANTYYFSQIKRNVFSYYRKTPHHNPTTHKASEIYVHNHVEGANAIANKKCLFYYLEKYCRLFGEPIQEIMPETVHIEDDLAEQQIIKRLPGPGPWILKPGQFTNRGQGITFHNQKCSLLEQIKSIHSLKKKHKSGIEYTSILQKYIQPLLYNGRKFDIRVWVLWSGGQIWWYQQGYIRTSCKQFSYKNTSKFIHLTNDAIQSQSPDYGKYEPANKLSFQELQKYLQNTHNFHEFETQIVQRMKQITKKVFKVGGLLFNKDYRMIPERKYFDFQLFGFDFLIDKQFKPWLIQCNSNPCLQINCSLLSRLIPNMIDNVFSLTIDCLYPPTLKKKPKQPLPWNQQSFRFQLLYDFVEDSEMWDMKMLQRLRQIEFNFEYHEYAQKELQQNLCVCPDPQNTIQ